MIKKDNIKNGKQEFEKRLAEQKESNRQITKWRDLDDDTIYEIVNFEFIKTSYGDACVISLKDDTRVFAPSINQAVEKMRTKKTSFQLT